jgi:pyruvate dehydrogenase E2 component (dihydrolipoamide acetyltransferase)
MGEFVMPSLGADMDEGTLVEWLVKEGDVVAKGDIVAVVDTTKSAIEVEVFEPGVVRSLLVEPGTSVPVGTPLAVLEPAGQAATGGTAAPPEPSPIAEGEEGSAEPAVASPIVRHLAHQKGVDLATVVGTGADGVITREDVEAAAGTEGAGVEATEADAAEAEVVGVEAPEATSSTAQAPAKPSEHGRVRASPLARRTAVEMGVDLAAVTGTGSHGAVTVADVRRAAEAETSSAASSPTGEAETGTRDKPAAAPAPTAQAPAATSGESDRDAAKRRASAMRTTIANLMARSKKEIPHYYLRTTVDFHAADDFVRRYNEGRPVSERILPAALLLKAAALAVRKVPEMNGFFTDGAFDRRDGIHLGVAISLRGGGLVAPAIHDTDTLALPELMAALKDLVARTRAGRLRGSEMSDPTLTVTNLGDQGVEVVHGVIYPPQVALVGFGTVVQRPWAVDGMLTVRPVLTATLAADHRVSDGHQGGIYLSTIATLLQRPEEL